VQVKPRQVPMKLQRKLLSIGGTKVALVFGGEPDAAALVARGKLFSLPIRLRRGRRNDCHANAAALWGEAIERLRIVSGYALAGGIWRQHSWVVDDKFLYETTVKNEVYFGLELDQTEACHFWVANFLEERYPGPWHLLLGIGSQATRAAEDKPQDPST
jgi:hypothetical protein